MHQIALLEVPKKKKVRVDKQIENLAYVFTLPIVSAGPWNHVPEKVRQSITLERMFFLMREKNDWKKFREEATDVEAMWYLSSASMEAPLCHEWVQVYMWLFRNWCRMWQPEVPDFVANEPEELDPYLRTEYLNPLKQKIRRAQFRRLK